MTPVWPACRLLTNRIDPARRVWEGSGKYLRVGEVRVTRASREGVVKPGGQSYQPKVVASGLGEARDLILGR